MPVEIKPDDPTVTKQTMFNAYLHFCELHADGKANYPMYADWVYSSDEQTTSFRQGWRCAWKSAKKEAKA